MKKLIRWLGIIATGILFMNTITPMITLADQPVSAKEPLTASYLNQKINNVNKDTIQDTNPKITLTSNRTGTYIIPMSKTLFITDQKDQPLKEVQVTDKQSQKAYQKEINAYYKKNLDDQSQKSLLPGDYYQLSLKAHQKLSLNLIGDSNVTLNAILLDKNNLPEMFQTVLKYQPKKDDLTDDQSKLFSQLQGNQTNKQLSKLPSLTVQWTRAEKENQKFNNVVQGIQGVLNKASTATKTAKAISTRTKKPAIKFQNKNQKRVQKASQKMIQSLSKENVASKKNDKRAMNIKQTAKNQQMKAKVKSKASQKVVKAKKSFKKVYPDNASITEPAAVVNSALAASDSSKAKTVSASKASQSTSAVESSANISMFSAMLPDVASSSISGQQIDTTSTATDGQQKVIQDVYVDSNGVASLPTMSNPANVRITWALKKGGNVDNDTVKDGQEVVYQFQVTANLISGTTQIPIKGLQLNFNPSLAESTSGISGSFNGVNYKGSGNYGSTRYLFVPSVGYVNIFSDNGIYGNSDELNLTATGQSTTIEMQTTPMNLPTGFNLPISFQLSDQSAPNTYLASMDSIHSLTIQANNVYSLNGTSNVSSGATYNGNYSYHYKTISVDDTLVNTGSTNGYDDSYVDPKSLSYDTSMKSWHDTSGTNNSHLVDNDSQYQPVNTSSSADPFNGSDIELSYIDPNAYRPNGPANPNATTGSSAEDMSTISNVSIKNIWNQDLTVSPNSENVFIVWTNPLTSGDILANFEPTGVEAAKTDKNASSSTALGGAANYMPDYFEPTIGLFDKGGATSGENEISNFEVMMNWNPNAFKFDASAPDMGVNGLTDEDNSTPDSNPYGRLEYGVLKDSITPSDSEIHSLSDDDYNWSTDNSPRRGISAIRYKANKVLVDNQSAYMKIPLTFIGNSDSTGSHLTNGQTRLVAAKVIDNGTDLLSNDQITQPASMTDSSSTDQSPSSYDTNWMAGLEPAFRIEPGDPSFTENLAQSDFSSDKNNQTVVDKAKIGDTIATNRFYQVIGQTTDYSKLSDSQILDMVTTYLPQIYGQNYMFEEAHQVTFYLNGKPIQIRNEGLDLSDSATKQAVLNAFRSGEVNSAGGFWVTSNPVVVNTKDVSAGQFRDAIILTDVLPHMKNFNTMSNTERFAYLDFPSNNGIGINESINQHFGNLNSEYTVKVVPYFEGSDSDTNLRGIITLPYNGDQAGSSFSGTNTLQSIKTVNDNNQIIDYWYSTSTNEGRNSSTNISNDTAGNWQKLTDLNNIPSDAKSIAYQVEGTDSNKDYEFDLTFQTNGNQNGDIYQNTANVNSDSAYQAATNAPTVSYLVYDENHAQINKTDGSNGNGLAGATFKLADSQTNATAGNYLVEYNNFIFNKDDAVKVWKAVKYDTNNDGKIDSLDYQAWLSHLREATFTTDSNGKASVQVPDGHDYYAVETQAPNGYNLADPTKLTLSSNSSNITPTNIKDYNNGTLTLDKVAQDTGANLTGAKFKIYDSDGNEVTQDVNGNSLNLTTTGSDGKYQQINVKLKPETYTVVETKAPTGYELFKQTKTFTITGGKTTNISFSDAAETAFPNAGGSLWKTIFLIVLVIISSTIGYCFERSSKHKHLEN